jgi:von Willebrand factor A domain-containing protein 8
VQHYCWLVGRGMHALTLTRDSSEADLKQRREICSGSVVYYDSAPVQAALGGHVLLLDGLERAERNVLPTLNNLLENREMALPDGRFLVHSQRFDDLLGRGATAEALARDGLLRVDPSFRVFALTLPVPAYPGFSLDPPLRSRFQARHVPHLSMHDGRALLRQTQPALAPTALSTLTLFAERLHQLQRHADNDAAALPLLPDHSIQTVARVLSQLTQAQDRHLPSTLRRYYPIEHMDPGGSEGLVESASVLLADSYGPALPVFPRDESTADGKSGTTRSPLLLSSASGATGPDVIRLTRVNAFSATIDLNGCSLSIPCGPLPFDTAPLGDPMLASALVAMLRDHAAGRDMCVVGRPGEGKSTLARAFARVLGYRVASLPLYRDVPCRDLLQRFTTTARADTDWADSILLSAACRGDLLLLDGLHRVPPDVISTLQQFIWARQAALPDGSRLRPATVPQAQTTNTNSTQSPSMASSTSQPSPQRTARELQAHPAFRIVAMGNRPTVASRWITAETAGLFAFHTVSPPTVAALLARRFPALDSDAAQVLSAVYDKLSGASGNNHDLPSLSLRALVRLARLAQDPDADLFRATTQSLLVPFLTPPIRDATHSALLSAGLVKEGTPATPALSANAGPSIDEVTFTQTQQLTTSPTKSTIEITDTHVCIGGVSLPRFNPQRPELVPQTLFFAIPAHVRALQAIMRDLSQGEKSVLLIGNQACTFQHLHVISCESLSRFNVDTIPHTHIYIYIHVI